MPRRSSFPEHSPESAEIQAQLALDAEYSPSLLVPRFRSVLSDYRRLSDVAKEVLPCKLNVRYGEADGELLHHFPPRRAGSPLLAYVHGGHWQELGVDDSCFAAVPLVAQGAGFIAIGYRPAPKSTLDAMVRSVGRALDWILANASALGSDSDAIYAAGSSAGAHLLAMALASTAPTTTSTALAGLTLLSGVYELSAVRLTYVNSALRLTVADAARNSPVHCLPLRAAEVLIARGGTETDEYVRQHELMLAGLRGAEAAGSSETAIRSLVCEGRNHFDLPLGLGRAEDELGRALFGQMRLGSPT